MNRFLPELEIGGQLGARLSEVSDLAIGQLAFRAGRLVTGARLTSLPDQVAPPATTPWRLTAASLQPQTVVQGLDSYRVIHGLRGELDLAELTPLGAQLLAAGSYLHAGGEASLGFGRYRWRQENRSG